MSAITERLREMHRQSDEDFTMLVLPELVDYIEACHALRYGVNDITIAVYEQTEAALAKALGVEP